MKTGTKNATWPQIKDIGIRVLNLTLDGTDGDAIQRGTEGCSVEDVDRRLKAFLNNGLSFVIKGPSVLVVDRIKPFNPASFIGSGVTIWRGPKDGNGLTGEEAQDATSLARTEIDFAQVLFEHCLKKGESSITGEEKLVRHIAANRIRLDAKIGQCLLEEKDQATLEWMFNTFGITWFELPGTVLRDSDGYRYFLFLYRGDSGRWHWDCSWLDYNRFAQSPSAVLAS